MNQIAKIAGKRIEQINKNKTIVSFNRKAEHPWHFKFITLPLEHLQWRKAKIIFWLAIVQK